MFELKYKITDADMKAVNKSVMWLYFIPYLIASLVGIAVGITATVLRPRTEMLVLGIILIVLGAILLGCALLLLIAPKNFVMSALIPDDNIERNIKFSDENITVSTDGNSDIVIDYFELTKIKLKKTYILAYLGKAQVLIVKDTITSGQTLEELFGYIKNRLGKILPAASSEGAPKNENEKNAELTDTLVGANNEEKSKDAHGDKSEENAEETKE